jgi:putative glutamine amidotransferase
MGGELLHVLVQGRDEASAVRRGQECVDSHAALHRIRAAVTACVDPSLDLDLRGFPPCSMPNSFSLPLELFHAERSRGIEEGLGLTWRRRRRRRNDDRLVEREIALREGLREKWNSLELTRSIERGLGPPDRGTRERRQQGRGVTGTRSPPRTFVTDHPGEPDGSRLRHALCFCKEWCEHEGGCDVEAVETGRDAAEQGRCLPELELSGDRRHERNGRPATLGRDLRRYDREAMVELSQGRPLVGMTGRRWPASVLGDRVAAPIRAAEVDLHFADYSRAVAMAGGLPVGLSRDARVDAIVERIDGLVLSGGADVDPARYGQGPTPECGTVEIERDAWELALVEVALTAGIPVFGICRGIQVLNVARGGTLIQDLPVDEGDGHLRLHVGREVAVHAVKLEPGSLAASVYGTEVEVNSLHHQAVGELGSGLVATGHSPDGTVEALEMPGSPVFGVQWHPEMLRAQPDPGFLWLVARASGPR